MPLALIALLLGLIASTAGATGLVFSDGFESGNLSQWTASSGMVVQQQVTYAGSYAARATATGSPAYAYKTLSSPLSELYYDGRFQAISQDSATNASLVRFRTSTGGAILSVFRRSDTKLSYYNEVTGVTTVGPVISAGTWHELEVHVLVSGTSSVVEIWLDGTRIINKSAESLGTTPVGRVYIGDNSTGRTFDFAFDNEIVSTSSDVSPPTAPTNLTANVVGSLAVDLSWNGSTDNIGVTGYTVYRNGSVLATVGGGTTTYHDATVISGTTYTYTVDAVDAAGNHSAPSSPVTVTPVSDTQPPSTPTGLTATAVNPTRVDLSWTASTDNNGVTGYTIYRNGTQLDVTGGATTSYSDTTASPATQYSYTVDAFDAAANHSAQSSPPAVVTTPSAPSNTALPTISGTAAAGQTLTADPGQWSGSAPITYTFQWRSCDQSGNNCTNIAGATSQTYVLVQADIGTTLRVVVTGTNPYGSASATSAQTAVVVDPGPLAPVNTSLPTISGTPQAGETLTADPGQWSGTQPISFAYQWDSCDETGSNCVNIFGATSQTYTLTLLDVDTTVRVEVTGSNTAGSSTAISNQTAVISAPAPIAPSNTSPPTISGNAVVGQTLSGDNGTWSGTQPISYSDQWRRCDQSGNNCADISGATAQTYTLVGADLGMTIRFAVTASNAAGSSTASSTQTAIVVDSSPPSPPTNLAGNAIGPNRVDLSWTASNDNIGVAGYTIYRNGSVLAAVSAPTTTYSDTTVSPSTTYTYTVDAFDAAQNHSAQSSPVTVTTPAAGDTQPPTVPTGLTATVVTTTRVDLSWTASTDNVGVAGYTVYRNGSVLANVGSTSFSDLSAVANTTYTYRVDAFDAAGNHSAQSSPATVTMPGTLFSDDFETGNLSKWTSSSGMTVQQQVTYAGSWAARAASTGSPAYAYKTLQPANLELYYDGRFNAISQASGVSASLVRFRTASAGVIMSIFRRQDNKLSYSNEVAGTTTLGPTISGGVWHELEVHVLINGTSSLVEVWLDGTRVINKPAESLGTTPVGRIYIGDSSSGRTFDFAFDNEIVTTAADVSPPTTPTGLATAPIGSTRLNVTWNASQDNNQLAGYTLYRNGNAIATLGPNTLGYADSGLSPSTTYSYAVDAFDGAGNRSARSASVNGTTGSTSSGDPVVGTAGDIACDPGDGRFNGGNGTATACRQMPTSNILFGSNLAAVLPLGDNQYEDATQWKFMQSYDASWGRVMSLTRPVPGNHEYLTQGAAGYYSYFGSRAGDPTKGYYSYDIGAWHIIALNSECANVGGCGSGSPEETWLRNDLNTHSNACTLAYWHRPRFTSGFHGTDDSFATWWFDLYNAHADIVLNGHDHDYERFALQDDTQHADPNGIREFVVGTGGQEHEPFIAQAPNSQVFNADTFGVLKLTLHSNSYDWQFVPEAGGTFTDSGSDSCH